MLPGEELLPVTKVHYEVNYTLDDEEEMGLAFQNGRTLWQSFIKFGLVV